jgi:hypothetical protein
MIRIPHYALCLSMMGCHATTTADDTSAPPPTPGIGMLATVEALRTGDLTGIAVVDVGGYYDVGDGGGGRFVQASTACEDDGGSMLADAAGNCFFRVTSSYGPREWGAKGDGVTDDTRALQAWLDTKALPHEPGMASQQDRVGQAGSYLVTDTIICHDNTTIRARGITFVGSGHGTYDGLPPFAIVADSAHWATAGNPLVRMQNYCRISGVALIANSTSASPIDAVSIAGFHVVIDEHSSIIGGRNNVIAAGPGQGQQQTGFQIKDSQILEASDYNLDYSTVNTRLVGNIIGGAGIANIHFTGVEITIANNNIEDSKGDGIVLDGASLAKIIGNQINHNGTGASGYGIQIRGGSSHIAVTGNELNKNNFGRAPNTSGSHVLLVANGTQPLVDVSFSGNVYSPFDNNDNPPRLVPDFAYDVQGSAADFSAIQLYEAPAGQGSGVYTPNASTVFTATGAFH